MEYDMPLTIFEQIDVAIFPVNDAFDFCIHLWWRTDKKEDKEKILLCWFRHPELAAFINTKHQEQNNGLYANASGLMRDWARNEQFVKMVVSFGIDPCLFIKLCAIEDRTLYSFVVQSCLNSGRSGSR